MRPRPTAPLAALLCAFAAGCGGAYRAETTLHADGSLDRAVYQPADGTPDAARQVKLWKETTYAPRPDAPDRAGRFDGITLLPPHARDNDHPYFAAWNHFASAKDLPEHVLFKSPEGSGLPDGRLERELTRTDLGFVEEFRWGETLTDATTLADMPKARDELADGAVQFGRDVFVEAVGKDYDPSDLVRWADTEGKAWFREATDALSVGCAAYKGQRRAAAVGDALEACCERHGLRLKKDGEWLKDDAMTKAVQDFVVGLAAEKVRKDGKPVGRDAARAWLDELNSKAGGRFKPASDAVIARKYGGEKAFGDRLTALITRVFGLYHVGTAAGFMSFEYTMTFPGPVVETDGELLGAGDKVRWIFAASDAFPLGYTMEARCLAASPGAAKALAGREGLTTYADLVGADETLQSVMRRCRAARTLDPLDQFLADQKRQDNNPARTARAEKLLTLLKGL